VLTAGMLVEAFLFALSAFDKPHKEYHWEVVYPELAADDHEAAPSGKKKEEKKAEEDKTLPQIQEVRQLVDTQMKNLVSGVQKLNETAGQLNNLSSAAAISDAYTKNLESASAAASAFANSQKNLKASSDSLVSSYESIAANIVAYRNEHGAFRSRRDLKNVPRLGEKAFEQCAGFLRIRDGEHPLDASAVHPERYALVEKMAADLDCDVPALLADAKLRSRIDLKKYVSEDVGLPTLQDILKELEKPGRDPREKFEVFSFKDGVHEISDLKEGMRLPGIVTNVTAFGAFVDIGVHQDGLVHVSQLSDNFVKDPAEVVKVGQKVSVSVVEVDVPRRRIGLSMKTNPGKGARSARDTFAERDDRRGNAPRRGGFDRGNGRFSSGSSAGFGSLGDFFK